MKRSELSYMKALKLLLAKDLRLEFRSMQTIMTMLLFGAVLTIMYGLGFEIGDNTNVFPGVVWGSLLFTGALGVGRSFARESVSGAFEAIILSQVPRSALLWSKIVMNIGLILFVMAVVVPLFVVMLRVDVSGRELVLALQVLVGTIGFCAVATPLSVIATGARFPEVLLPMVIFPLVTPVLIAGVKGTSLLFTPAGSQMASYWPWMSFSCAFAVVFLTIGVLLFDRLVTE